MARWIYQAKEERVQEKQRQEHFARVFPVAAESLWAQLCDMIRDQLRALREEHPDVLSSETQMNRHLRSVRIEYTDLFPHYFLCLVLDITQQELTVQQIKKDGPGSCSPAKTFSLPLSLDEHTQMIRIYREGRELTLEGVAELCLRPILDFHPVNVVKIRDIF